MHRSVIAVLCISAVLTGACRPQPAAEDHARARSAAHVVRTGFSIRRGQIGTGALIRVDGDQTVRAIELEVSFFAGTRRIGTEKDTLRYCPPDADCWWGQSLFGERLGTEWQDVDRVAVIIAGDGGRSTAPAEVRDLAVEVTDKEVTLTVPDEEGTVYLVAWHGPVPEFGLSFFTRRTEGRRLRYSQQLFPRKAGDDVIAAFYPGPIPGRVYGPTD